MAINAQMVHSRQDGLYESMNILFDDVDDIQIENGNGEVKNFFQVMLAKTP